MFILARAICGAGAAGLYTGSLSILAVVVPLSKRAMWIAALSSVFGLATISGPIVSPFSRQVQMAGFEPLFGLATQCKLPDLVPDTVRTTKLTYWD